MSSLNLYIVTYGCQMNVYDSSKMEDILTKMGYNKVDSPENADIVVINTCNIREKAAQKLYAELGQINIHKMNLLKNHNRKMIIVVAGCVAQAEGEYIIKRAPYVDIVVGPQSYQSLPELVGKIARDELSRAVSLDFDIVDKFDKLPETTKQGAISSFLSAQEGCDKFCSFCCVPYTRGAEFSRPLPEIYREALHLSSNGSSEIILLGQNVNAYLWKNTEFNKNFKDLIDDVAKIPSVKRIRYTTSHPKDVTEEQILAHKEQEKLMPYLHLPIQSGSDKILKLMNRKHSAQEYIEIIAKFREARPDIAISGDFIVGFPGETDKDFENTLDIVRQINYSQAYSFKYSPRHGTPAAYMENQVDEHIKSERLSILAALLNQQQEDYNKLFLGKEIEVLFERKAKYDGQIQGKSPHMQTVNVVGGVEHIGHIRLIKITKALGHSLLGELI